MKKVISIGIPVYNEEANIQNVLKGILNQKEEGFTIKEIIVISDGSTDNTVKKIRVIKDKRIKLADRKKRVGKSFLMNYLFNRVDTEILVMFDGDVVLADDLVIKNIIHPILEDKRIGLTSGDFQPIRVHNFVQKAIQSSINVYEELRYEWKGGHNAYGSTGRIMALSKKCYKSLHIPPKMVLNDIYAYFAVLKAGFEFRHVKEARVYYQLPENFSDHISQTVRSAVGYHRISKVFGKLFKDEYAIPKERLYRLMLREFAKNPLGCLTLCFLNRWSNLLAKKEINKMDAKWDMATTTKKLSN